MKTLTQRAASRAIEAIDVHGRSVGFAKSSFRKETGIEVKARNKDEMVTKLSAYI